MSEIELVQSSVVDGRAENGRYRQDQLQSLHKKLREEAGEICSALLADAKSSIAEAETEYYLTMDAVRNFYDSLDFKKDLEDEYLVAHGKDNADRRVGAGLVVIRPTTHTRFYSIVTPLAAAIAAGNCVILELPDTLLQVDSVLRPLLTKALNPNTFCTSKSVSDQSVLDSAVLVDQTGHGSSKTLTTQLLSSTGARSVAIVDRSANIDVAAKAITTARFSFGGTSPYAPDLVLVNEFIKKEFFEACSKYATLSFAKNTAPKRNSRNQNEESKQAIKDAEAKRQVSSFGSDDFKLVDILDKDAPIMNMKINGCYLPIATCSSLVDAMFNQQFENPLLAGYLFAEPNSAKYLSQFLPCHISCINQIPVHLLVGPAAPIAHKPDFSYRYNKEMFSVPRPQFVEGPSDVSKKAGELLSGAKGVTTAGVRAQAVKALRPTGQPENKQIGYFEQGILVGLVTVVTVVLPVAGVTTYFAGRKGVEYASRLLQH